MNAGTLAAAPTSDTNDSAGEDIDSGASIWPLMGKIGALANSKEDYRRFYRTVNGERIRHWWSHILLNLKMLPSLNMCGFLYTSADLGGFGADTTRDLLLRWLALGIFTPLMRDHAAAGTRDQECFRFENLEDFRHVVGVRYRLIPYLYSEYMKDALGWMRYNSRPVRFTS